MGTTKHCYIQNIEALGLLVSEKKFFFSFSHCKSMETIYPRGVAKFDPRGMAGTISNCYIQNIKAVCPVVSEKIFEFFSHSKFIETINLRDLAKFDPRGMNGTIYVEDH